MADLVLLGPQRFEPSLRREVDSLGISGRIAAVTAGWQEREGEDAELRDHLGRRVVNLRLHYRAEQVFAADEALFAALRRRQNRLKELQKLYRLRLDATLGAARELLRRKDEPEVVEPEQAAAIEALRDLDTHLQNRVRETHRQFEDERRGEVSEALEEHRAEILEELTDCEALAIAGGHVAVLLNRLRLFDVLPEVGERPMFAWSAGAMVLAERIVLFHDSPPQGAGNAEVLESGFGLLPDILPLPHAARRLRLADPLRVALFSRRFAPLRATTLDAGARLVVRDGRWVESQGVRVLYPSGAVRRPNSGGSR
ncbi:MAG: hypothetical protein AAF481_13420 [Acidobacteriota bacterium]